MKSIVRNYQIKVIMGSAYWISCFDDDFESGEIIEVSQRNITQVT
jgi:hypothetical protein